LLDLQQRHRQTSGFSGPARSALEDTKLDLPTGGATHIVSANDWGPEARSVSKLLQPHACMPMRVTKAGGNQITARAFRFVKSEDGTILRHFEGRARRFRIL